MSEAELARFWAKVNKAGPVPEHAPELGRCWEWTAGKTAQGYGKFRVGERTLLAHRVSREQAEGPIPSGHQVDHRCKNPSCIRPRHLEAVTGAENNRRSSSPSAVNSRKGACERGHTFTPESTYRDKTGRRHCRPCRRIVQSVYRERKRASRDLTYRKAA